MSSQEVPNFVFLSPGQQILVARLGLTIPPVASHFLYSDQFKSVLDGSCKVQLKGTRVLEWVPYSVRLSPASNHHQGAGKLPRFENKTVTKLTERLFLSLWLCALDALNELRIITMGHPMEKYCHGDAPYVFISGSSDGTVSSL